MCTIEKLCSSAIVLWFVVHIGGIRWYIAVRGIVVCRAGCVMDKVWTGMVWYGMVRYGKVWYGDGQGMDRRQTRRAQTVTVGWTGPVILLKAQTIF